MSQHKLLIGNKRSQIKPPLPPRLARKATSTFSVEEEEEGEWWYGFDRRSSSIFTGLVPFLNNFARKNHIELEWVDKRKKPEGEPFKTNFTLREYQEPAAQKLVSVGRGSLSAGTGSGKCLSPSSMIFTGRGLLTLNEIAEGCIPRPGEVVGIEDVVASRDGQKQVATSIYNDGERPVHKVTLADHIEIKGTAAHKLLCADDDGEERFVPIEDLAVGDYVCLSRGDDLWGDNSWADRQVAMFDATYEYGQARRIHIPPINEEVAYFLGAFVADGSVRKQEDQVVSFCIHKNDEGYLRRLKGIVEDQFGVSAYIHTPSDRCHYVRVSSYALCDFLQAIGVSVKHSHEKVVPRCIRTGDKQIVINFLRGLVDGDGCVEKNQVSYSTSSKSLADVVQLILLNLGIVANRRMKETYCHDHHVLTMSGAAALRFLEIIGFRKNGKKEKAERLAAKIGGKERNANKDVVPHAGAIVAEVVGHVRAQGHYANRFFGDRWQVIRSYIKSGSGRRMPTYDAIEKLIDDCEAMGIGDIEAVERLRGIRQTHYYYARVEAVEEYGRSVVFDLTVPETHSYVANGIVSHNTVIALDTFARIGVKGVVVVPTQVIWTQFIKTAIKMYLKDDETLHEDFNVMSAKEAWEWAEGKTRVSIGVVGQSNWKPGFLTIAIANSLDGSQRSRELLTSVDFLWIDETHHLAADTWFSAVMRSNAYYRFGGSGTVMRADGQDTKLFAPTGPVIYTITTSELIRKGWLAKPVIKMIRCDVEGLGTPTKWADYYRANVAYASERTAITLGLIRQSVERNIKTLCLFAWDEHATNVISGLPLDYRSYIDYIQSGHGKKQIKEAIERFANGEVRVLLATPLLSEGYDLCSIDRLIRASGMKSFIRVTQETGRVLRIEDPPEKGVCTEVFDFYDHDGNGPLYQHSQERYEAWESEEEFDVTIEDTWMQGSFEDILNFGYGTDEERAAKLANGNRGPLHGGPEPSERVLDICRGDEDDDG